MFDDIHAAFDQFEKHVPYSDAAFLILKAHLVVELHLLEFIRSRVSDGVFQDISKSREGAYAVRILLARALADRDEIPPQKQNILWPALEQLGTLRNRVAHVLESKGSSLADMMRAFIKKVDPDGEFWNAKIGVDELHREFRNAAQSLTSLLVIHREPHLLANEMAGLDG